MAKLMSNCTKGRLVSGSGSGNQLLDVALGDRSHNLPITPDRKGIGADLLGQLADRLRELYSSIELVLARYEGVGILLLVRGQELEAVTVAKAVDERSNIGQVEEPEPAYACRENSYYIERVVC